MTQTYFPFDSGAGASVTESEWRQMASLWLSDGVIRGLLDGLEVSQHAAGANKSVDVATGVAWLDGHFFKSDAVENLTIEANTSGNDRIDRIVVKADLSANTIALVVVKGTAAATPVPPALTQSASLWEIPLAQVAVADSFTSIATADITDDRQYAAGIQDWQHVPTALTFSSDADAPTFVMTAADDLTGIVPLGARFRCVQASGVVYGIVTAVASGSLTIYGGTNYTLADEAVSSPEFSIAKVPVGFPLDDSWCETLTDTTDRIQSSATGGTWYNPGALSLAVPIGLWRLSYKAVLIGSVASNVDATLSTASNAASDADLTTGNSQSGNVGTSKVVAVASKTTYYLICKIGSNGNIGFEPNSYSAETVVRAECAYL